MESEYKWTPESISHFWDSVSSDPRLVKLYFTRTHGRHLIDLGKLFGLEVSHQVLDYGCGPGYLSTELVSHGFKTSAIEFSPQSAQKANERLSGNENWLGCDVQGSDNPSRNGTQFDWVFSIETFEHLLDEWIPNYVKDLRTKLKPGGKLLLSTPSNENLDSSLILCPNCGSKFHRWGHLRSVAAQELCELFSRHGFRVEFCQGIDLSAFERAERIGMPCENDLGFIRYVVARVLYEARKRIPCYRRNPIPALPRGPHLILVASP